MPQKSDLDEMAGFADLIQVEAIGQQRKLTVRWGEESVTVTGHDLQNMLRVARASIIGACPTYPRRVRDLVEGG